MRRYLILLATLVTLCATAGAQGGERPRIGVALSGGGAKGAAHIGVLKALEEAGIPIDYVAGTSMGAVIGGLYAAGYTPDQLDSLVRRQDWELLLSDQPARKKQNLTEREYARQYLVALPLIRTRKPEVGGLVRGQNLAALLASLTIGYHDSIDFDRLPTPFACVATNIVDGKEVDFRSGTLATAIRASMAIPGVFTPVRQRGMILVDGGLVNNYPVDLARRMGADIVIGVTVQNDLPTFDRINNLPEILTQIATVSCRAKYEENLRDTDLHLRVPASDFTMMDFRPEAIDSLIKRGRETTLAHGKELAELRARLFPGGTAAPRRPAARVTPGFLPIQQIRYENASRHEIRALRQRCKLADNKPLAVSRIDDALRILQEDFNYPEATYTLAATADGYDLTFHVNRKNESNVRLGVRFDSEETIAALLKGELFFRTPLPSSLAITGKVGKQYLARVDYTFEPLLQRNLNLSYEFRRTDMNIYKGGNRQYNLLYRQHAGEARLADAAVSNFQYQFGFRIEHYDYNNLLADQHETALPDLRPSTYLNYFARVRYNSQDRGYYPTKGVDLRAAYTLVTDNFTQLDGGAPLSAIEASGSAALSFGKHLIIFPSLAGRVLLGSQVPVIYSNAIGGNYEGKYLPQQLPFIGITNTELQPNALVVAGLRLRQRIKGEHYASLIGNLALGSGKMQELNQGRFLYGVGIEYGYNSKFGPMEASLGYAGNSRKPTCLLNLGYYF